MVTNAVLEKLKSSGTPDEILQRAETIRNKEINESTGYSLKEVKSHIQTGKIRLRKKLTKSKHGKGYL